MISIVATLLALACAIACWNYGLASDLCRMCLGAGNPLGKRRRPVCVALLSSEKTVTGGSVACYCR